jgi:antitoxin ParD1/3/4
MPPALASWILDKIARGVFADPSEAVFVLLGEQHDLEPHADLRQESMRRSLQAAMDDPRPGTPVKEVLERLRQKMSGPRLEPAVWLRR